MTKWPKYKNMQVSLSVLLMTQLGHHAQRFTDERTTTFQKEKGALNYY